MVDASRYHEHPHLPFHRRWGGFAEELFHYTSRYYFATEAFLRNLAEDRGFSMGGYKAARLSELQRDLMAAALSCEPDRQGAQAIMTIIEAAKRGDPGVEQAWLDAYQDSLKVPPRPVTAALHQAAHGHHLADVPPLDPFLNIAQRLQMAVAVRDHHVEVSMHSLAEHLDSGNTTLRDNLQQAVIQLHDAGYVLRNHPNLTHSEACSIGDEGAV